MEQEREYALQTEQKRILGAQSVRALVFGVLSIAASGSVGLVFAILALGQGKRALQAAQANDLPRDGRARAGRILGVVGLATSIATVILTMLRFLALSRALAASIESGSLGYLSDWFRSLGESLRDGFLLP